MKSKVLSALVCGLAVFGCSHSPSAKRTRPSAKRIKVEVLRGAKTVTIADLPKGQVKVAAQKITYDAVSDSWKLAGGFAVTIIQDQKRPLKFEGSSANVTADNIEWQLRSASPLGYENTPLVDLSEASKQDSQVTLFRVKWFYSMGSYQSSGTALYDRKQHTIKEHILVSDDAERGIYSDLYTNVDDAMIQKAATEQGTTGGGPFDFGMLSKYGARRQEL